MHKLTGGVFTATESAAIAVVYSLLVSVFVYKGLDWKGVWHALDECVNTLSIVLILIATSAVFGNCLTMLHVPDLAATAITALSAELRTQALSKSKTKQDDALKRLKVVDTV